jgi:hypothetical protein
MMALATALLALAAAPHRPVYVNHCRLNRLSACRNTSELVVRPEFERAIRAFARDARVSIPPRYKEPLWAELLISIQGPPGQPVRLPDGSYAFAACVPHACMDTGAVVVSPKGKILAAAMFTGDSMSGAQDAPHRLSLDIFVRDPDLHQPWRSVIEQFGRDSAEGWRDFAKGMGWTVSTESATFWLITPAGRLRRLQP